MTNRRVQSERDLILYPATDTTERQYCAYTTWWANGEYDGSIMLRTILR